jgi:acylphosphatase
MAATNPNDTVRVHIWVTGRVQGVGFRAYVMQSGALYGLTGWVRNVGDDMVETVAEGRRDVIERFVGVVKSGPRASHVVDARVEWENPSGDLFQFQVRF